MAVNIFIGIIGVISVAAGIWGWWLDNGGSFRTGTAAKTDEPSKIDETKEKN